MYNRILEWRYFQKTVERHVEEYTIPQYGDSPDDEVENWTPEMCMKAIQKYTKRFESGQRGEQETVRDMLKIAHFACLCYFKLLRAYDIYPERKHTRDSNPFVHGGTADDPKQSN
jgi:hypothetical protein